MRKFSCVFLDAFIYLFSIRVFQSFLLGCQLLANYCGLIFVNCFYLIPFEGITIPAQSGSTFKSSIDWNFNTVPQTHATGQSVYTPRGRVLGGSSAISFLAYTRGNTHEYDSWNRLGNTGWSFSSLLQYFKKSETFIPPTTSTPSNENITIVFDQIVHGSSGPVQVSYPTYVSPQFTGFYNGLVSLGIPVAKDLSGGNNIGVSWNRLVDFLS